jgi:hypothetical protein
LLLLVATECTALAPLALAFGQAYGWTWSPFPPL